MRGFPPLHLLVLALAFAAVAVPLAHLTGGGAAVLNVAQADEDGHDHHHDDAGELVVKGGEHHPEGAHRHESVLALIRVRYAHRPAKVSLLQEGRELLAGIDLNETPADVETQIEVSHEGNEFQLSASWPEGTPETALTVEIEPDGFETESRTVWTAGPLEEEVVEFQW